MQMAEVEGALRSSVRDELRHIGSVPAASKLFRPAPGLVPRTSAVERVHARDGDVVTVTAPAGYGKSTFVAELAATDPRPTAWVSLTAAENDPAALLTYVAMAIDDIDPVDPDCVVGAVGADPDGRLAGPAAVRRHVRRPPAAVHPRPRRHARAGPRRGARRPARARRRAATRLPPRARWPPRDPLAAGPDPRAAPPRRGRPDRPGVRRARGRHAVRGVRDRRRARRVGAGRRTDRGVATSRCTSRRSPTASVAARCPSSSATSPATTATSSTTSARSCSRTSIPTFAAFLLDASCLDRISGRLCDDVLERSGSANLIERIRQQNLLVIPLDDRREWYRFHHLMTEFLRSELERRDPTRRRRGAPSGQRVVPRPRRRRGRDQPRHPQRRPRAGRVTGRLLVRPGRRRRPLGDRRTLVGALLTRRAGGPSGPDGRGRPRPVPRGRGRRRGAVARPRRGRCSPSAIRSMPEARWHPCCSPSHGRSSPRCRRPRWRPRPATRTTTPTSARATRWRAWRWAPPPS